MDLLLLDVGWCSESADHLVIRIRCAAGGGNLALVDLPICVVFAVSIHFRSVLDSVDGKLLLVINSKQLDIVITFVCCHRTLLRVLKKDRPVTRRDFGFVYIVKILLIGRSVGESLV